MPSGPDYPSIFREDILSTDGEGNNLFHHAIILAHSEGGGLKDWDRIRDQGVDIDRPNKAGRTPLHVFCSTNDEEYHEKTRWILNHTKNADAADEDGIRPLHLACMWSEHLVRELLEAGADPSAATLEGLTPLHLAARARQPNIIGMLLSELRSRYNEHITHHLEAKDGLGRTPLHHACRSGRYESVSLLLAAGADAQVQDKAGLTPLGACTEFEDEQALWNGFKRASSLTRQNLQLHNKPQSFQPIIAGTKLHDELRPFVADGREMRKILEMIHRASLDALRHIYVPDEKPRPLCIESDQDTARLEEILRLLLESARRKGTSYLEAMSEEVLRCIGLCKAGTHVYTLRCLKSLGRELDAALGTVTGPSPDSSVEVENGIDQDLELLGAIPRTVNFLAEGYIDLDVVQHLLRLREYDAVRRLLCGADTCSSTKKAVEAARILRFLAFHGYHDLLSRIFESTNSPDYIIAEEAGPTDSLLFTACQRPLPNMEVVRLIIDKLHGNPNAQSRTDEDYLNQDRRDGPFDDAQEWSRELGDPFYGKNTPLHELAQGRHWWHAALGIPHLLSSGAKVDIPNEGGMTPLDVAKEKALHERTVFARDAVRALGGVPDEDRPVKEMYEWTPTLQIPRTFEEV